MLYVLGSIAQFEREIMLERQREGIAKAKAEGLNKGRKPTAQRHKDTVIALHKQGMGVAGILRELTFGTTNLPWRPPCLSVTSGGI
jgi:DNA invertase Pin-like site-specific DNA recombinase